MDEDRITAIIGQLHAELDLLIWCITWDYANNERWRLNADELHAELLAEMVHVVNVYSDRGKTYDDLRNLVVVSLRNRCKDIAAMEYGTHRMSENGMASLDTADGMVEVGEDQSGYENDAEEPSGVMTVGYGGGAHDRKFDLDGFLGELTLDGQVLAQEVLSPGKRLLQLIDLAVLRKQNTSPKGYWRLSMTPLLLRRAMGWPKHRFDVAWAEVRRVLTAF